MDVELVSLISDWLTRFTAHEIEDRPLEPEVQRTQVRQIVLVDINQAKVKPFIIFRINLNFK